jgi:hypothetical protein
VGMVGDSVTQAGREGLPVDDPCGHSPRINKARC